MGQTDVYEWLKVQALVQPDRYFTTQEIIKGLKDNGASNGMLEGVRKDCIKLVVSGCIKMIDLDKSGFNNYNKVFQYGNSK
jgi:hypothetical protein